MERSQRYIGPAVVRNRLLCSPGWEQRSIVHTRARRVTLLVIVTAVLGLLDLAFTLTYASSIGMIELNPLARMLIGYGGASELIRFKLFTIALSGGTLYLIRHRKGAELCAWLSLAVLVGLSFHWVRYTHVAEAIGPAQLAEVMAMDQRVMMVD